MTDTQVDTRVGEVLAELAALEDPRAREVNERHGDDHGVNLSKLRGLAKALKIDQDLALQLWATDDTAARLVAILISRPKLYSAAELDAMLRVAKDRPERLGAGGVRRLGERDRVPIWIRDLHVTDAVRVGLDRLVLDALGSEMLEERVEPGNGEGDPTRTHPCHVRLDEERGVLVDIPEHLVPDAKVSGSPEEPGVPVDAGVEIGYRDTGVKVGDRALHASSLT